MSKETKETNETKWVNCTNCPCLSEDYACNLRYPIIYGHVALVTSMPLSSECQLVSINCGGDKQYFPEATDLRPISPEEYRRLRREAYIKILDEVMGDL